MKHSRDAAGVLPARSVFPDLAPAIVEKSERARPQGRRPVRELPPIKPQITQAAFLGKGQIKSTTLSFSNLHEHGDLFINLLKARKKVFIDRLHWSLPEAEGMEFDQYDTPLSRWIVVHEFGEILAGIRLTPTTARCGVYSYMLRDGQNGLLEGIPTDVLFFQAPISPRIWEASRLFVSTEVPAHRRMAVQAALMGRLSESACSYGATHVIGIVPAIWSRWLRRLGLNAVPVGPKFSIENTISQAALFPVGKYIN